METTKRQAELLCKITKWIDCYSFSEIDKAEIIRGTMTIPLEENIKDMQDYIAENYEIKDLLEDKTLIELIGKLYNSYERTKKVAKNV